MSNTLIHDLNHATSESWAVTIVFFTGLALTGALVMEHAFAMDPCPLCLMQRIWFFIAGAWAYASLLHNPRWGIYPLLGIASASIGGGFAIRQLWLQNLPADRVPTCGPDMAYMLDRFPLSDLLIAMTSGTGDCAEVIPVLGLSIALWALLGFIIIIIFTVMQWRAGT